MSTSGQNKFNPPGNILIRTILENIQDVEDGDNPTAEQIEYVQRKINFRIKNWAAMEIFIWNLEWLTVPLIPSTIVLSSDGLDYKATRTGTHVAENIPITGGQYPSFWRKLTTTSGTLPVIDDPFNAINNSKV